MKKIILILLLFSAVESIAQSIPGYTWINSRNRWFVGLFNGLGLPAGDSAHFQNGQVQMDGAMYFDSTDNSTPAGLYIYYNGDWVLQGTPATTDLPDLLLAGGSVTPLGGYDFAVQAAIYRIDGVIYASDSGTVTIDSSDATLNRIDRIYLARDELIHVLVGELATNALEPQLDGDQIGLAFITIPAGSDPFIVTTKVYDENTESVVTNTGTTTDGNNATNVYTGTKSLNVTNINNNDVIFFTKAPALSTWETLGFDGLSMFIKLKTPMPTAGNLRVQLFVGTVAVSSEVIIPLNKTNVTTYQAITVPASAFGNITNTQVTRVRIRYTRAATTANYTGFYLDNMFFMDGVSQPTVNDVNHTLIVAGFTVSPQPTIGNTGTWNVNPTTGGAASDYYSRAGSWVTFPDIPTNIGFIGDRAPNANRGITFDSDSVFLDSASATNWGVVSPEGYTRIWTNLYISNAESNIGDSLAFPKNDSTTGIKLLVAGSGVTLMDTDSTIVIAASGGGASRFGVPGEDDTGIMGVNRSYTFADDESTFEIKGENVAGFTSQWIRVPSTSILDIGSTDGSSTRGIAFTQGNINVYNLTDPGATTYKIAVIDSTTQSMYWISQSVLGGGGGSSFLPVTGTGTATGNITGDLDGNTLTIEQGGLYWLLLNPTAGSEQASLRAFNTTGSGNQGVLGLNATNTLAVATLTSDFDGASQLSRIELATDATTSTATYTAGTHTFVGTVTIPTPFTLGATSVTASGTELNFVDGVTSDIQTQFTGKANLALSNLASVAVNTSLISDADNTDDLGSSANGWKDIYSRTLKLDGSTSGTITVASDALSNVARGTNLSGTGAIPFVHTTRVLADETLANSNADQNLFGAAHDVITVQANTTYQFYITGDFTHSAVAHSIALGFTPTTATVSSIEYNARAWVTAVGTATASGVHTRVKSTATTIINLSGANATESFEAWGTITIGNTGGTITPQIKFSADPTGTILLKAGARMIIWAVGTDTFTVDGNIN